MLVLVEARNGMENRPFRQRPTILAKDGYNFSKSVCSRIALLFLVMLEIEHFCISSPYYEDDPLPEKQQFIARTTKRYTIIFIGRSNSLTNRSFTAFGLSR